MKKILVLEMVMELMLPNMHGLEVMREVLRVRLKITSRFGGLKTNGSIVSWFHCCRNLAIEQLNNRTIKLGSYF
jgi:hypothetical protein